MVLIYTTFPDWESAERITKHLLKEKLIACANLREHKAFYWWKGEIQEDSEVGAVLKTRIDHWKKVKEVIKEMHPYDVPVIVRIDVDKVNEEYLQWLIDVT
ncbi:divalent-cation tolerance protein CutA [Palaeococcus pacificus]|nr:divalent-cation tolerance protein CutA [Palaeococcus pacificus]